MFYAEIQDGQQKWQENTFWKKVLDDSVVENFIEIALTCAVSGINVFLVFYTEIQDGRQKWREAIFDKKEPDDSVYSLWDSHHF